MLKPFLILIVICTINCQARSTLPIVINTWRFVNATKDAWQVIYIQNRSALDAIEVGCSRCEVDQCDGTVGWGGSPDENSETTLDALIMDGTTHNVGAVGGLRRIKNAISVARKVLDHTKHSLLVGDLATQFAIKFGFKEENLTSNSSQKMYQEWKQNNCQPNNWLNVVPDPTKSCGPYHLLKPTLSSFPSQPIDSSNQVSAFNHDTIGMVVIDKYNKVAAGTSTNGLKFKIPGRVGDSPIPGSGAYADGTVGGAAATGNGDVIMRFLPSYQAVEGLRNGLSPQAAAEEAIQRIGTKYPKERISLIVASLKGEYGAACMGLQTFPFSVQTANMSKPEIKKRICLKF